VIVIWTGVDAVAAPALSVAMAVRLALPEVALDHVILKGNCSADPIRLAPSKKSTRVTKPSSSLTSASTVMEAPELKLAPWAGVMRLTPGG
jgi:hypothetical protein